MGGGEFLKLESMYAIMALRFSKSVGRHVIDL